MGMMESSFAEGFKQRQEGHLSGMLLQWVPIMDEGLD